MLIQTLLIICIVLAILIPFSRHEKTVTSHLKAYEEEHVAVYDMLVYDGLKNENELTFLKPYLSGSVLDVGCGTGHHVHELQKKGVDAIGMDLSPSMIKYARKYPYTFLHGNALNMSFFPQESFQVILCMYFTIYYMKHKETFFQNARHWLVPGGYLVLHLSKTWNYGPTSTFKGSFLYQSTNRYELITKNGVQTKVEHKIYMESIDSIVQLAKRFGFTVETIYTYPIPYKDQYLYVFKFSDVQSSF